jgi:hypothetical protein
MFDIERDPFESPAGGEEVQTINEARDSIRYGYANGWAHVQAVADRVSVLAYEGRLSTDDRDRIHGHLRRVFGGLDRLYDEGCGQPAIDAGDDARHNFYSDGSPVYSTVRPAGQFHHLRPPCIAATSGRRMKWSPAPR